MDETTEPRGSQERMNWADVCYIAIALPLMLTQALSHYLLEVAKVFVAESRAIDRRKEFTRQASLDIETLTGGGE